MRKEVTGYISELLDFVFSFHNRFRFVYFILCPERIVADLMTSKLTDTSDQENISFYVRSRAIDFMQNF